MIRGIVGPGTLVVVGMIAIACGGAAKPADAPATTGAGASSVAEPGAKPGSGPGAATAPSSTSPTAGPSTPAGEPSASPSSSPAASASAAPATPPPPAHPFAHNAEEATSLIDDAITARSAELTACVDDARKRRKEPHAKIVITIGIDENGRLIGVEMPKGEKKDKALSECLLTALRPAPFPQSHAGVITVRRTFEDKAVYR